MPPRMLVQSEGRFQEDRKLSMVKAQTYRNVCCPLALLKSWTGRACSTHSSSLRITWIRSPGGDKPLIIKKRDSYATMSGWVHDPMVHVQAYIR